MPDEEIVVKPYRLERECCPQADVNQLVLKAVDASESVYSRLLVQLANASLPDVVVNPSAGGARSRPLLLPAGAAAVRLIARDIRPSPGTDRPPIIGGVVVDPVPPVQPPPEPSPPEPPELIVHWDLYLMLKYRQDWKPSGYGLGQLVYSVSLMPNEELTLEVKTWETSRTQQDQSDETDVKNTSDIKTTASDSKEASHSDETKTHEYVDAKASYSGFGFSAEVSGGWSQDVSTAHKTATKQAQERSQQATSEYRSTHKVHIATSREAGSEARTSRKIRNVNQAHTLNANYFEILREFEVSLVLYDVAMVLLGAAPSLVEPTPYLSWDDEVPHAITLGELVRRSRDSAWIDAFVDAHGLSPIQVLRERWAEPLYTAAPPSGDVGPETPLLPEQRAAFRAEMLRYVRPSPGWVEPDSAGALRWAYEVLPGQESRVLQYLYGFVPYSASQTLARATRAGMERASAYRAIVDRVIAYSAAGPNEPALPRGAVGRTRETAPELRLAEAAEILVPGPFEGTPIARLAQEVTDWVARITRELEAVRATVGATETWKTTLPTSGVYADLALGICSGAEDYLEIQRQYDLEMKRLEIEKLHLEVERLRIEKDRIAAGHPASSVVVDTPAASTTVNLGLTLGADPRGGVEVKTTGGP